MESIGKTLHEARIKKGLTIEDVELQTGIRKKYLAAIENDDYAAVPGEVFVKGIIRTYGNHLDLNGPELVDIYKAAVAGSTVEKVKSQGVREVNSVKVGIFLKQQGDIGGGRPGSVSSGFPIRQFLAGLVAILIFVGGYFLIPRIFGYGNNTTNKPAVTIEQKASATDPSGK
ncbi:MAG: helix-turn-helix domain-containing protein [Phascolarctobacterium sp.]|nr:helix-turn-helix domain-containing protein [Phascolarctobacterium sp.]